MRGGVVGWESSVTGRGAQQCGKMVRRPEGDVEANQDRPEMDQEGKEKGTETGTVFSTPGRDCPRRPRPARQVVMP